MKLRGAFEDLFLVNLAASHRSFFHPAASLCFSLDGSVKQIPSTRTERLTKLARGCDHAGYVYTPRQQQTSLVPTGIIEPSELGAALRPLARSFRLKCTSAVSAKECSEWSSYREVRGILQGGGVVVFSGVISLSFISESPSLRFNMRHNESPIMLSERHCEAIRPCRLPGYLA
jgi:hypothetical protein